MKFVVETSAFADAVTKAARVAPTKGHAFDAAAGIVVEFDPANIDRPVTVKATDLESTFLTKMHATEASGPAGAWRLPATVLAGFLSQLPLGNGQTVEVSVADDVVTLKAGRTKARLRTIDVDSFPKFRAFSADDMTPVEHFAQRVEQVAWAVDRDGDALAGVHIDGTRLVACNRIAFAEVPCVVPVEAPITVPLVALSGVMKNTAEVSMRASERRLHLMTDQDTQASTIIIDAQWPDLSRVRTLVAGLPNSIGVAVEPLVQVLQRMMVLCKAERYPLVKLTFGDGVLAVEMDVPELGVIEDELDVADGALGSTSILFTPTLLTMALSPTKVTHVTVSYGDPIQPIGITDGSGYQAMVMPRRP